MSFLLVTDIFLYKHLRSSDCCFTFSEFDLDEEVVEDFMIKRNGSVALDGESLRRSFRRSLRKQESKISRQVSSAPSEAISWDEEDEVVHFRKY